MACQMYRLDSRLHVIHNLGTYLCHSGQGSHLGPGIPMSQQAITLQRKIRALLIEEGLCRCGGNSEG